ncbi:MAG: cadherin-like beta sandwich domain-containing protein, partial [Gammaproteobacteria bacterium]|nr:cadherin-like beta sandwich domain-containing protein [Gammaproteobacteria bacterium]
MRFSPGSASLSPSLFSRLLSLFMLIWLVACGQGTPGVQQRANANLLDMQVMEGKGSWYFDYELSRDRSDYRLMVDSSQDQLVLVVKPEDIDAMVEINGQDNMAGRAFAIALEFGQNTPIEIVVTAADGSTQRVYTVTVLRPNNRSAQLQSLRVEAAASLPLAPNFSPDVLNYKLTVPYGQSSVSVVFTAHPQAAVLVDNQPVESGKISPAKMLQVGSNYIQILVRAQDGISTQSYNIEIIREGSNAHKQNDRLQSLQVDGFGLDKPFQPALSSYRVNVGNSVSSITVQPVPQNELATVTVDGRAVDGGAASVPLQLGTQNVIVKVVSEDGKFEREYILTVTRQLRIEARLQSLSLTAANKLLDFGFSSEISSYDLSVPNSATSIMLHPKAVDADALIEIDGKVVVNDTNANVALPNVGVQQVLVTVSAQDRSVRRSYVLNVNRVPLTNVKLRSLELPADLQFSFSPAVTEYAVTVPFERDNLALTAMLDDASSSLKINGAALPSGQSTDYLSLVVGSNRIELLVTDKYGFDHNRLR